MACKCIKRFGILVLGVVVIALSGCTTCGTPYRRELSRNSGLKEANESYKKAIDFLDRAECAQVPANEKEFYTTAESYLSDAIFKLNELGNEKKIDVSEDVYYCEKIKRETDVKIGASDRQ